MNASTGRLLFAVALVAIVAAVIFILSVQAITVSR